MRYNKFWSLLDVQATSDEIDAVFRVAEESPLYWEGDSVLDTDGLGEKFAEIAAILDLPTEDIRNADYIRFLRIDERKDECDEIDEMALVGDW